MLSLREKLAQFIMKGDHTVLEWTEFQKQIPNLRLKTVSQGKVLISFNAQEFEQPIVWLSNFQAQCIERYEAERRKLLIVLPEERQAEILKSTDQEDNEAARVAFNSTTLMEEIDKLSLRTDLKHYRSQGITGERMYFAMLCKVLGIDDCDTIFRHAASFATFYRDLKD